MSGLESTNVSPDQGNPERSMTPVVLVASEGLDPAPEESDASPGARRLFPRTPGNFSALSMGKFRLRGRADNVVATAATSKPVAEPGSEPIDHEPKPRWFSGLFTRKTRDASKSRWSWLPLANARRETRVGAAVLLSFVILVAVLILNRTSGKTKPPLSLALNKPVGDASKNEKPNDGFKAETAPSIKRTERKKRPAPDPPKPLADLIPARPNDAHDETRKTPLDTPPIPTEPPPPSATLLTPPTKIEITEPPRTDLTPPSKPEITEPPTTEPTTIPGPELFDPPKFKVTGAPRADPTPAPKTVPVLPLPESDPKIDPILPPPGGPTSQTPIDPLPLASDAKSTTASATPETQPIERPSLPVELRTVEPKPVEPKPAERKADEPKPVEPKPVEPASVELKPVEPKPVEPKPIEPKPSELTPDEPKRIEPQRVKALVPPVEPEPKSVETVSPLVPADLSPEPTAKPNTLPTTPVNPASIDTSPVITNRMPAFDKPPTTPSEPEPESSPTATSTAGSSTIRNLGKRRPSEPEVESPPTTAAPVADAPMPRDVVAERDRVEPILHTVASGENFWTISRLYYRSGRYYKALHSANRKLVPKIGELYVGTTIKVPPVEDLDPTLSEAPSRSTSGTVSTARSTEAKSSATRKGRSEVELSLPAVKAARVQDQLSDVEEPSKPTYKVRPHDTLRSIARDTLGDPRRYREILEINRNLIDDTTHLTTGQTLTLPDDATVGRRIR